jgi:hypothetical protein
MTPRSRAIVLMAVMAAAAAAQTEASRLTVRSIRVRLISTSSKPLVDIPQGIFAQTLKRKGIALAVENRFDESSVEQAAEGLRGLYADAGQEVRVEHAVSQMPPHSLEVSFEIIQLCTCH